jgi:hypothetical protein
MPDGRLPKTGEQIRVLAGIGCYIDVTVDVDLADFHFLTDGGFQGRLYVQKSIQGTAAEELAGAA